MNKPVEFESDGENLHFHVPVTGFVSPSGMPLQMKKAHITFHEYQFRQTLLALYPTSPNDIIGLLYTALGVAGEAGEVANKVKKILRDGGGELTMDKANELAAEVGDVLWYCSALCNEIGCTLEEVAEGNLKKLEDRKTRGKIKGSGDNR